jgi:uncharacterized protein
VIVPASDVAFTPSVKAEQERRGSRAAYARLERRGGFATDITPELAAFLGERDSIYVATASAAGQPYIQHRGGAPGFVHVLDAHALAFADLAGNRQYITLGNLRENERAFIFAMDYAERRRVKLWGRARVVEDDPALLVRLGSADRAIVFTVDAWDVNCPQHIPRKLDAARVEAALRRAAGRIAELEAENARLRAL